MSDEYGSNYLTIADEDGNEYELEILATLEYNGATYHAVIPAEEAGQNLRMEVSIMKSIEEDDENILCIIEDEQELQTVNDLIMDMLYEDPDTDDQ